MGTEIEVLQDRIQELEARVNQLNEALGASKAYCSRWKESYQELSKEFKGANKLKHLKAYKNYAGEYQYMEL